MQGKVPTVAGYYWFKNTPSSKWQIVHVSLAGGSMKDPKPVVFMFGCRSPIPFNQVSMREGVWGPRVEEPASNS